jgi:hypothetical protein
VTGAACAVVTEYAGKGPKACWDAITVKSAQLSGIVGDSAHTYGYHRGRNYVSSSDYSVQQADDRAGPGEAASALDVTMNDADMKTVSKRLNDAVNKKDSRLHCLREWYGTTNGTSVTGRDVRTGNYITSDSSHLWHVHLSFYRKWADDPAEAQKVAAVFNGTSGGTSGGGDDDMPKQLYLTNKKGQVTKLAKAGTWYCVGWDAALANTGGSSLTLPDAATLFDMSAWLYTTGMGKDDNLYWRVQTLDRNGKELAKYPIGELRATTGDTNLQFGQVGSVAKKTNLRILVASTANNVAINSAWWRCFYW